MDYGLFHVRLVNTDDYNDSDEFPQEQLLLYPMVDVDIARTKERFAMNYEDFAIATDLGFVIIKRDEFDANNFDTVSGIWMAVHLEDWIDEHTGKLCPHCHKNLLEYGVTVKWRGLISSDATPNDEGVIQQYYLGCDDVEEVLEVRELLCGNCGEDVGDVIEVSY